MATATAKATMNASASATATGTATMMPVGETSEVKYKKRRYLHVVILVDLGGSSVIHTFSTLAAAGSVSRARWLVCWPSSFILLMQASQSLRWLDRVLPLELVHRK